MTLRKEPLISRLPETCMDHYLSHKWAKGDTPEKVAKLYGHQKFETIWGDTTNKALVRKRRNPGGLQPGDELSIPPDPAARKRLEEAVRTWNESKRAYVAYASVLEKQIEEIRALLPELHRELGKLHHAKMAEEERRKAMAALEATMAPLTAAMGAAAKVKLPVAGVNIAAIKGAQAKVEAGIRAVLGAEGAAIDAQIKALMAELKKADAEVRRIQGEIEKVDRDLDRVGMRTINAFCREKSLQNLVGAFAKLFRAAGVK